MRNHHEPGAQALNAAPQVHTAFSASEIIMSAPQVTTSRRLMINTFLNIFTQLITVVIGSLLIGFFLGTIGEDLYGIWILVGSVFTYRSMLTMGLNGAVNRYIPVFAARNDLERSPASSVRSSRVSLPWASFWRSVRSSCGFFRDPLCRRPRPRARSRDARSRCRLLVPSRDRGPAFLSNTQRMLTLRHSQLLDALHILVPNRRRHYAAQ